MINLVNTILCLVILFLGYLAYSRTKDKKSLYIGIAFGLFAISHLITLYGANQNLEGLLVVIRIAAYLVVIFALSKLPK